MSEKLEEKKVLQKKLRRDLSGLEKWLEKELEHEVFRRVLSEKKRLIGEFESRRGIPVMLLQDLANDLPESVRMVSLTQGFTADQLAALTEPQEDAHFPDKYFSEERHVRVRGFGKSIESITRFGNRILHNPKYWRLQMKQFHWQQEQAEYSFELSFRIRRTRL